MKHSLPSLLTVGAALLLGSFPASARAATMILHNFTGGASDGSSPYGSLTLSGSKLYGMTGDGGSGGQGTVFRMNLDGSGFSLLHSFGNDPSDGTQPLRSLTISGTKLYGMTTYGGTSNNGVIFSVNTNGTGYGLIHSFLGGPGDGAIPSGALTLSGTKLYGMTGYGGSTTQAGNIGYGTLFSVNTNGTGYALLHSFTDGDSDGLVASGSLTLSGSTLYGMTSFGGTTESGTIFSISTNGSGFILLHKFNRDTGNGYVPAGSLTLFGSTLYGMTNYGGSSDLGALFSIATDGGGYSLLESFASAPADAAHPTYNDLTISGDGSTLYGMTTEGGTANKGVVFSRSLVPEPGTFALLGLGTLLLSARRRNARA